MKNKVKKNYVCPDSLLRFWYYINHFLNSKMSSNMESVPDPLL